jgi:hypothetical protein
MINYIRPPDSVNLLKINFMIWKPDPKPIKFVIAMNHI